jgi:hypothetical protein
VTTIDAGVVVAPDDTVTIRFAQTELGQSVWTPNAMMVCEELQCDWSKVSPQYASANRDGREMAATACPSPPLRVLADDQIAVKRCDGGSSSRGLGMRPRGRSRRGRSSRRCR